MYSATSAPAAAEMQQGQHYPGYFWPNYAAALAAAAGHPGQSPSAMAPAMGWGVPAGFWPWPSSYPYGHVMYGSEPEVPFVSGDPLKVTSFDVAAATQEARAGDGLREAEDCCTDAPGRPSRSAQHVHELVRQFGRPSEVGDAKDRCERYMANLDGLRSSDRARRDRAEQVMDWVTCCPQHLEALSLSRFGCRALQKAIEVGGSEDREAMAETLIPMTSRLIDCKHGNHVLAKLIEVLPPVKLSGVIEILRGQTGAVSRKRFGCRILERLIEHCNGTQVGVLLDEVVADVEALARHQYGNFVVQHLFEHGDAERKARACAILQGHVVDHAKHRTASHVVQRILEHADTRHRHLFVAFLLAKPAFDLDSLEAVMTARYGSFVVQQLVEKEHPLKREVEERVRAALAHLRESQFARRNLVEHLARTRPDFFKGVAATSPCCCDICNRMRETRRTGPSEEPGVTHGVAAP